jgi:hypothetical protein
LRLKKGIFNAGTIGMTASNRLINGESNGAASFDVDMNISDKFKLEGQFSLSYGDYDYDNTAFYICPSYESQTFHFHLIYFQIDERFWDNVNSIGFILDDDRKELDASLNKKFKFTLLGLEWLGYDSNYNVYWGMDNTLRSWRTDQEIALYFDEYWKLSFVYTQEFVLNEIYPKGIVDEHNFVSFDEWEEFYLSLDQEPYFDFDHVFNLMNPKIGKVYKYIYLGKKEYKNHWTKVSSRFDKSERNSFVLACTFGKLFRETFALYEVKKGFKISKDIYLELEVHNFVWDLNIEPAYTNATVILVETDVRLAKKLNFRAFFQSSSRLNKMNLQLKLKYDFIPHLCFAQLVFQNGLAEYRERGIFGNALFLKFVYSF